MSGKTPSEIKAMVEQAKAIALAKAQMLQQQHQAATSTAAPPNMDDIARRKAALAARMAALTASKAATSLPAAAVPAPVDARTRAAQMGSMISTDAAGNLIINSVASGKKVQAPSFATVKINQKPEPKKELRIERELPDELVNPEINPYLDPNLSFVPKERVSRPLKFAPKGKFISIANQIRTEQRIEQFRKELEEQGHANVQEEDLQMKDGFTKRDILKDGVEWWDAAFLPNKTYEDIAQGHAKIETADSLITHFIQHPVQIQPPNEAAHAASSKPRPLMLTTKERKKLRRQKRKELLKEKQDKIRLGLLAPDAPKVKLANMMRVLGQEAVLNPTEVEMRVRQQVEERLQGHLEQNAERKLTPEQRKAKEAKKKEEDLNKGVHVSVYKINDLSHSQKRFKVDKNAQQLNLTGVVLIFPTFSMVVVEGGQKAINQYKKLMLRRIDWTDNTRQDGTEVSTVDNKCLLVWEGQARDRQFKNFHFITCRTDAKLKETLSRYNVQHYWDQALGFKEEDMLGATVTL